MTEEMNEWRTAAALRALVTYVLVAHVPVGSLSVGHDLPHDDAEAPDVRGGGEAVVLDGLGSGPQHHALPAVLVGKESMKGVEPSLHEHPNILSLDQLLKTSTRDQTTNLQT